MLTEKVLPAVRVNVPVELVIVIAFSVVQVAAPRTGVVSVGEVAKTNKPVPVSSEMIVANCAEVPEVISAKATKFL